MPRLARLDAPGILHHVMGRGIEREKIFIYVLSFFGQNRYRRRNYQQYVQKGVALGRRPELVGGGLVRSLGGW